MTGKDTKEGLVEHEQYIKLIEQVEDAVYQAQREADRLGYDRSVLSDLEALRTCESLVGSGIIVGGDGEQDDWHTAPELLDAIIVNGWKPTDLWNDPYDALLEEVLAHLEEAGITVDAG